MGNSSATVAKDIVKLLKEKGLIAENENKLEEKLASGAVKDTEWKVLFEQQLKNQEKASNDKQE